MYKIRGLALIMAISISMSCQTIFPPNASSVSSKAYIGMSLAEFKELAKSQADLQSMEAGYAIYKMSDTDFTTKKVSNIKFFYFDVDNKLYKIDTGEFRRGRY